MANPINISTPNGVWTSVAQNTTLAFVRVKQDGQLRYLYTYRLTGDATPSDDTGAQSVALDKHSIRFSHSDPIDCYVKAVGAAGEVLVMV